MIASQPSVSAAVLTDASGVITTWNRASEALFGLPAHAVVGQCISKLLAPDARLQCLLRWPGVPTENESLRVNILQHGDEVTHAMLTLIPQTDADGKPAGCVASFSTLLDHDLSETVMVGQTPLANMADVFAGTFYVINREGHFVLWNTRLEQVAEMTRDELRRSNVAEMFDPDDRAIVEEKIRRVFEHGEEVVVEARYISRSGKATPYLMCGTRITCRGVYYLCGMGLDTSHRHEQEAQLRLRERALHAASNAIVIARCAGNDTLIEYVNPAFEHISGYTAEEVLGRDSRFMAAQGFDVDERTRLRDAVAARRPERVVFRNRRKSGEIFWNELAITPVQGEYGDVTHFIGIINDVTESKQRTADLEHEVNHDALTGLASRNLMWDRLEQALHMAQRNKSMVATVLIDLDGFKQVNDTLGHEAGDQVLVAVAQRLSEAVRDVDTVARLSGDEFVLVLTNQPSLHFTAQMAERLRHSLTKPIPFGRLSIPIGASMGISVYPNDATTAFDLMRAADAAMYHTKANGKGSACFFSDSMKTSSQSRERMETAMRSALDHNEMFLLYQPRFSIRTGRMVAVEALLRWRHPEQGLLLPSDFLPEAEENGLIVDIGEQVLDAVCKLLVQLVERGRTDMTVSLNASYREFSQHHYISHVADKLRQYNLASSSLELEFREDQLVRNQSLSGELAEQMSRLGLRMAIDGFGDGMTNLHYLHSHHVSRVKLNRNALHQVENDPRDGEMARALIDIGHNLHIGVVAQGVETLGQLNFVKASGCDEIQGRYISDPLTREGLERLLAGVAPP